MRILKLAILAIFLTFLLCGCHGGQDRLPDYRSRPYRAEVRWSLEGSTFGALVTVTPVEGQGSPDIGLEFLYPEELNGLCARRTGGEVFMTRHSVRVKVTGETRLLWAAEKLAGNGERKLAGSTEKNGVTRYRAEIRCGEEVYVCELDENGIPKKLLGDGWEVDVIRFEFLDES